MLMQPTAVDLAYAAGLIDGEGTIGITYLKPNWAAGDKSRRRRSPLIKGQMAVSMCDGDAVPWLRDLFGGSLNVYKPVNPAHRPQTRWSLQGSACAPVCALLLPYLKVKHRQAELVVAYYADPRFVFKRRASIPAEEINARLEYVAAIRNLSVKQRRSSSEGGQ